MPLVYYELRRQAAQKMAGQVSGFTLQPTALVHEAWLRLGGDQQPAWEHRRHFFGAAAEAMRQILIERARRRAARKHGGGQERVNATAIETVALEPVDEDVLAVSEALERLARLDPPKAELVRLRYFAGLTLEQAAETLGMPLGTAKRAWRFARAWLGREIRERSPEAE